MSSSSVRNSRKPRSKPAQLVVDFELAADGEIKTQWWMVAPPLRGEEIAVDLEEVEPSAGLEEVELGLWAAAPPLGFFEVLLGENLEHDDRGSVLDDFTYSPAMSTSKAAVPPKS